MNDVIPFPGPIAVPDVAPYERFCAIRREMARAFVEWLNTRPADADAREEIDGTQALLEAYRQIGEVFPETLAALAASRGAGESDR